MKPIEGYELVNEAGEYKPLPKGIYGVVITDAIDYSEKEYLEIHSDIVKGEYANYFKALVDAGLRDTSTHIRSYKTKALPFFKAFITAVEKSNPGYKWDWDEKKLIGKKVIAVFGEEEYLANDGTVKVATRLVEFRSLQAYQEGRIKVPELKKLPADQVPAPVPEQGSKNLEMVELSDEDLPF